MQRQTWIETFIDWDEEKYSKDNRLLLYAHINHLDAELHKLWSLGRNLIISWTPIGKSMQVLVAPHYAIANFISKSRNISEISFIFRIISERKCVTPREMTRLARSMGLEPYTIKLPFEPGVTLSFSTIDSIVRRYSISHGTNRAVALMDIVGFSLLDPLDQVTQINSLSYSVNSAYAKLTGKSINIKFARSTTGDGFYIWNRSTTMDANRDLYYFLLLILADNAVARTKGAENTVPLLRAAFHLGDHYEFYQSEGLSPTTFSYIVGDVTIQLARMVNAALPGQILIGDFDLPYSETDDKHIETTSFISSTVFKMSDLNGLTISGDEISEIKCYLTGKPKEDGSFGISRFSIKDKHDICHDVFNAKMNVYRTEGDPIFLGLQHSDLEEFSHSETLD